MERFTLQDAVRRNGQGSVWSQVDTIGGEPVELQAVATRPADGGIDLEALDEVELIQADEDDYDFDLDALDAERLFWHGTGFAIFAVVSLFCCGVCVGILLYANAEFGIGIFQDAIYLFFDLCFAAIYFQDAVLNSVYDLVAPILDLEY